MRHIFKILIFLLTFSVNAQVESIPEVPNARNWSSSISYDFSGATLSKGISYFNNLGKSTQSQNWDILTGKIWTQETRYDSFDRPVFETISAPTNTSSFGYLNNFISVLPSYSPMILSNFDSAATQANPPQIAPAAGTLGWYYSTSNTYDPYQDVTSYPYTRVLFSDLNPGTLKSVVGGNKVTINGQSKWLQTYTFSMPIENNVNSGTTLPDFAGKKIVKTVFRGADGAEVVMYDDTDGNPVATSRSGNEATSTPNVRQVYSQILDKGFVDIHIPVGCGGTVTINSTPGNQIRIYDLLTEQVIQDYITYSLNLNPGFYRIEDVYNYYGKHNSPTTPVTPVKITYNVNYYDYAINKFDLGDRLVSSVQPLGSTGTAPLETTYTYNTFDEVVSTTNPDEGITKFKYRNDSQIRFSQNSEQAKAHSFSYTNYDYLGRPIESGVYNGTAIFFSDPNMTGVTTVDPIIEEVDGLPVAGRSQKSTTLYDVKENSLIEQLEKCGLPVTEYVQTFIAGNVSFTRLDTGAKTWYSYDAYDRVRWIIQELPGLSCVKSIDYTYSAINGQLEYITYQKYSPSERFIHKYEYNAAGQLTDVSTAMVESDFTKQAHYIYNEAGILSRTELAENLQGIDYIYNLEGQLKAINHPGLLPDLDPGNDGNPGSPHANFAADIFGMGIDYHTEDYARTGTPAPVTTSPQGINQYNGNIKSTRWKTRIPNSAQSAYSYQYNKNNWLSQATFGTADNAANIVPDPSNDYKVSGITYDANGNIKTLNRKGYTDGTGSNQMDNFTYRYSGAGSNPNSNRLLSVKDTEDNPDANRYSDLRDQDLTVPTGSVVLGIDQYASLDNYVYNDLGQLVTNMQDKTFYEYNDFGQVSKISTSANTAPLHSNLKTLYFDDYSNFTSSNHGWVKVGTPTSSVFTLGFPFDILGYCSQPELDMMNTEFGTKALQINGKVTARKQFRIMPNTLLKVNFDLILDKIGSVLVLLDPDNPDPDPGSQFIEPSVVVNFRKADGTIFHTQNVQSQPAEYCTRYFDEHIQHEFVSAATDEYFTVELVISSVAAGGSTALVRSQRTFVDNLKIEMGTAAKVKFDYNERGQRITKTAYVSGGTIRSTYYIRDVAGRIMAMYEGLTSPMQNIPPKIDEYPIIGESRIGVFKRLPAKYQGYTLYELTDHLGSVRAVFRKTSVGIFAITANADYYPFGSVMPNRQTTDDNYRFAFQGQEKDSETGTEAFDLRLWDGRLGRWITVDPYNEFYTPYLGMGNDPVSMTDPDGGSVCCPDGDSTKPGQGTTSGSWETRDGNNNLTGIPAPAFGLDDVAVKGSGGKSTLARLGRTTLDFIPVAGSLMDIYEGFRDGDGLQASLGIIFLVVDVATLGSGSLIKGGVKTLIKEGSEKVAKEVVEQGARKYWKKSIKFKNTIIHQRDDLIDVALKDSRGRSNLQRMKKGLSPIGPDGKSMNLHHMLQNEGGPIAEMTATFHKKNHKIIHINKNTTPSGINRKEFNKFRTDYWKSRANDF